ncbi:MAG: hypothetical protein R2834_19765, partial [Rhodothermales bacterium]
MNSIPLSSIPPADDAEAPSVCVPFVRRAVQVWAMLVLVCWTVPGLVATAQDTAGVDAGAWSMAGKFFMRQFGNDVYRADRQNWDIVQDAHGLMYFGNNHGVLEYDGIEWALIPIANNSVVRSL